jgi:hypothetical protein
MFKLVALVALSCAGAALAKKNDSPTQLGAYNVLMDSDPKFEFWRQSEEQPKKGTEKNIVRFKSFKECDTTTGECTTVSFNSLTWTLATRNVGGEGFISYKTQGTPVVHNFASLEVQVYIERPSGDEEELGVGLKATGLTPRYGGANSKFSLAMQRSHNPNLVFKGTGKARVGSTVHTLDDSDSAGNQVIVSYSGTSAATQDHNIDAGRFAGLRSTEYGAGLIAGAAAGAAVIVLGALAAHAWRQKNKKEEWETVEMNLP